MMTFRYNFLYVLFAVLLGCRAPEYPDFEYKYGFHYQLDAVGDEQINESDVLGLTYSIFSIEKNTMLNRKFWPVFVSPQDQKLDKFIQRWHVGDSITLILENVSDCEGMFVKYLPNDEAYFPLKLSIMVKHAVEAERFDKWYERQLSGKQDLDEFLFLQYLQKNQIEIDSSYRGIYFETKSEAKGTEIENGEEVRLKYTGYFLDGRVFDVLEPQEYFYYQKGIPDQLIKGLEYAIGGMKKGMKAKIIIPSQLAFGATGSSTGMVPPYTSVIYELEIMNEHDDQ